MPPKRSPRYISDHDPIDHLRGASSEGRCLQVEICLPPRSISTASSIRGGGSGSRQLQARGRSVDAKAIHTQPLHSPARTFNRYGSLRAIERRSASNNSGPRLYFEPLDQSWNKWIRWQKARTTPAVVRRGDCRLASIHLSAGNLRATLVEYQTRFFQMDVCLKESSRKRLVTALRNALDIAIVTGEFPLLETQGMPLWSERILLALLKEHPLASKDVVYWNLRDETVRSTRR